MKKSTLLTAAAAMLLVAGLFVSGCKKDDTTAPVVTLTGSSSMSISLNSSFSDPGATASDDKDGSVTVSVSGAVDKDTKGSYTLTYSATDAAGNVGTATRVVTVANDAEKYAGTYTDSLSSGSPYTVDTVFTQTITTDAHVNNRIVFSKLGCYVGNNGVKASITGVSVDLINQTVVGIGTSGCTHIFSNGTSGTISQPSGKYWFYVTYTDEETAGGTGCPGWVPLPTQEAFHQQ